MVTFNTMDKREFVVRDAVRKFFMTTTLHGFKYLCSEFNVDRIGWVISCCTSTCCAGVLFAVLWSRFLEVPALLQLQDIHSKVTLTQFMPQVTVCPPVNNLTRFFQQLNMDASMTNRLIWTVQNILSARTAAEDQLKILEQVLSTQNMTFTQILLKYTPNCGDLIVSCRWQKVLVACKVLFEKELMISGSYYGVCCIMRPDKAYYRLLNNSALPTAHNQQIRTLDLALQCSNETNYGCKFFAKYDAEPNVQTIVLAPGYIYFSQMLFNSVPMSPKEEFLDPNCIADKSYSKETCLNKCAEKYCGCSDPLHEIETKEVYSLPPCSMTQLGCLRAYNERDNITCACLPSCNQITSDISLQSTTIKFDTFTIDPIYNGLNTKSTVIHFRLSLPVSKIFSLSPTETWLTLLSSLGGVFNMFLGVGLFSALEVLFLLLFKLLPNALLKSQFN